jgi:hypothetical protein
MNLGNVFHRFVAPMVALAVAGALMVLGTESVSAQEIKATAPFSFYVDNQQYPPGTYRFTLSSEWLLFIHSADGKENCFPIRPERFGPLGSRGTLTFLKHEGHNELLAVYIPGTDMYAELIKPKTTKNGMELISRDHR